MPTWAGTTSPGTAAALTSQGSRGRMWSIPVTSCLMSLPGAGDSSCPGEAVPCLQWSHLHSRQKEQEVTGSSCRPKDHQILCCKGEKPQYDSHRRRGWRLPQKEVWKPPDLWQSFPDCMNLPWCYYIHFQKSLKKATWSYRFCNLCCILRYAPIILI